MLLGAGMHRAHIRPGVGLRHGKRADMVAGDQPRQIAALLVGAAVDADLIDAEIGMRAVGQSDRARRARDFLHDHAVLEITEAGAAPLLLDGDAMNAKRAERGPQIAGKAVAAVDLVGARRDFLGREPADALAQHIRRLAQAEIEAAKAVSRTVCRHLRSPFAKPDALEI